MRIHLPEVPTVVQHMRGREERAEHMRTLLDGAGFRRWRFFPAVVCESRYHSATRSRMAILERALVQEPFRPLLMLEDDVSFTPWLGGLAFEVPADADAVYLGLSIYGAHPERDRHQRAIAWEEVEDQPHLVRLHNMLSLHAVYIASRRWLALLMRAMAVSSVLNIPCDVAPARHMRDYRVYALRRPVFYQDSRLRGQEAATLVTLCPETAAAHAVPMPPRLPWEPPRDACRTHLYEPPLDLRNGAGWDDIFDA